MGVDINLAASNPWMASTLQFVAGLGPRKARALLQVRAWSVSPANPCISDGHSTSCLCQVACFDPAQSLWHEVLSAFAHLCADAS